MTTDTTHRHVVYLTEDEFDALTEALQETRDNRVDDLDAGGDQVDMIRTLDSLAAKFNISLVGSDEERGNDDACPGCGCKPGDGVTPGCTHPNGCGAWTDERGHH